MNVNVYNKTFNWWHNFANKEVDFFSTDTEELYKQNLIKHPKQMEAFNWTSNTFKYKFNSQGFRSDEFTTDSIMFLGCSITQGIGMPIEDIFPTIISKKLNVKHCNLGLERTSANTAFRLAYHYLPIIKPKILVSTLLYPHRLELLLMDRAIHFIPNPKYQDRDAFSIKHYVEYYGKWISQAENYELNYKKNILAINQLCDDLNIKFVNFIDLLPHQKAISMMQDNNSKARDLVHPGFSTHQIMAEVILNVL